MRDLLRFCHGFRLPASCNQGSLNPRCLACAQFRFLRRCEPFFALRLQQSEQVGEFAADVEAGPHEALGFKRQLGGDGANLRFFGEVDGDGLPPFAFEQLGGAVEVVLQGGEVAAEQLFVFNA